MSSSPLTPDQAKFVLALALPTLKSEHQTTKRVIEAIPLDKGDYRPDAVSKTALELAWHIVASEKRFFSGIPVGAFDFSPFTGRTRSQTPPALPPGLMRPSPRIYRSSKGSAASPGQDDGLPGHVPASRGRLHTAGAEPHHPPSRTALHVPASHGRAKCRRSTARATTPRKPGWRKKAKPANWSERLPAVEGRFKNRREGT